MLKDKKIVIIGGTTGIGLSAAKAFVHAGAQVVLVGRNPESGQAAQAFLGDKAAVMAADATDPATAEKAIDLCLEAFGDFD
ncbi:MAG TPA: SDR family NAD(P)-dependent oxidoreductase, partial [Haliscomenobacter sp.]|uniref:SDR family NAD(P)-dependent oxidoreductase n=1 Tax=Haliscomenobacter sp. TaxID=2717303 RepID=UPI002BA452A9